MILRQHGVTAVLVWASLLVWSCSQSHKLKPRYYSTGVLYGCETWSLALQDEYGLRVYE